MKKVICIILGLLGFGGIVYLIRREATTFRLPRKIPKGTPPGTYETNMEDWNFPED